MKRVSFARASCDVEPQLHEEALVVTHEGANEEDIDTYLQEHFYPRRPLVCYGTSTSIHAGRWCVFGRSANVDPPCPPKEVLRWWWKDARSFSNIG